MKSVIIVIVILLIEIFAIVRDYELRAWRRRQRERRIRNDDHAGEDANHDR